MCSHQTESYFSDFKKRNLFFIETTSPAGYNRNQDPGAQRACARSPYPGPWFSALWRALAIIQNLFSGLARARQVLRSLLNRRVRSVENIFDFCAV